MAGGLQGFGAGLLQGYETVDRIQSRRERADREQQRYEDKKAFRNRRFEAQQDWREQQAESQAEQREYERSRDEVADEQWSQEFGLRKKQAAADSRRADTRVGIAQQRANISAQNARTNQRMSEVELARQRRQARESENRRYLSAAAQELEANGPTQRFRDLAQKGGMDVDNMLDDDWQASLETLKSGLQGAPISRQAMVDAGNRFYRDRIERMVGTETPDGKKIVRSQLADFYPGPNGETAVMDLDVWTRDKNGKVEKYRAPATSNRRTDDEYVLEVPMDDITGNIAATDMANRMVDKRQLAGAIQQEATLNGASDPGNASGTEWARGPGNTLFNRQTGETRQVEAVSDENDRYSKALDMAQDDLQTAEESYTSGVSDMNEQQKQQWLLKRRDMYRSMMTPGDEPASGQPSGGDDPVVIRGNPQYGDITESDIQTTMQETGMSRDAVMERLNGS